MSATGMRLSGLTGRIREVAAHRPAAVARRQLRTPRRLSIIDGRRTAVSLAGYRRQQRHVGRRRVVAAKPSRYRPTVRSVFFPTPDQRSARRMARIARWTRPIDGRWARMAAWANMLMVDHGLFRLVWKNRHRVSAKLWRSNQPSPSDVATYARLGIRTVVNLRGGREFGSYPLEVEACQRHGLKLVDLPLRSRELPPPEDIFAAERLFAAIEYPAVIHCKSGADRAGFAAALYLILHENRPVAEAMSQLSPRFGHIRQSRTGVLDACFDTYLARNQASPIAFRDWVAREYDPAEIRRAFHENRLAAFVVDKILRRE
jgi:uncharacterized protein (TIGR01244 family)